MISEEINFYFLGAKQGPPLQENYIKTLQNALDETQNKIKVIALPSSEYIAKEHSKIEQKSIIWPYFRGKADEGENVLNEVDRDNHSIINDYEEGKNNLSDKGANYERAEKVGLPIPKTTPLYNKEDIKKLPYNYPLVVKGYPSGRGEDVHLCKNAEEANKAFEECKSKKLGVVAQEYIENSHGRDLRVIVVDGKIALMLGRQAANNRFLSNVSNGGEYIENPVVGKNDMEIIQKAIKTFPIDITGFDFLYGEDRLLFCEINLAPGWSGVAKGMLPLFVKLIISRAEILNVLKKEEKKDI